MNKPELEFFAASDVPWTPVPNSACEGLDERVLASDGRVATRILRFAPGTDTTLNGEQAHNFWEEVYILTGAIHDLGLGKTFTAGMVAVRPPGMRHGPWVSPRGCQTFEVRYGYVETAETGDRDDD